MAQAMPSIGSTTGTATIVNYAEVELSSSEEIDLAPGAPSYPRNVPDVRRVLVPPPPAYIFKDMEAKAKAKILGKDYPSPNSSFDEGWEIAHPPRDPPYPATDLRHLVNFGKKLEAWKEDCRKKALKRKIVKIKADLVRLEAVESNNNEQKSEFQFGQDEQKSEYQFGQDEQKSEYQFGQDEVVVVQEQEEPARPDPVQENDTDEVENSSEEF